MNRLFGGRVKVFHCEFMTNLRSTEAILHSYKLYCVHMNIVSLTLQPTFYFVDLGTR